MDTPPNDRPDAENQPNPPQEQPSQGNLPPTGETAFGSPYERQQAYGAQAQPNYAAYPRYFPGGRGPVPSGPPVVRFAALGEAWEFVKQDFANFAVGALVAMVLGGIAGYIFQAPSSFLMFSSINSGEGHLPPPFQMYPSTFSFWALYMAGFIVSQTLNYVLTSGLYSMSLKRLRGENYSVTNIFDGFKAVGPLAIAGLLVSLLTMVGSMLLVIPGIMVMGAFAFVPLICMDQKAGPIEAMSISLNAMKKDFFMMGILVFVASIAAALGFCACGIGVIFTLPILHMTVALHYHAYFPPQGGPQEIPTMVPAPQYSV